MSPAHDFPSLGDQLASSLIHFGGVALLSHCLSRRLAAEDLSLRSVASWTQISWPRLCVLLIFLDSWLFVFSSGVLLFGVGLDSRSPVCSVGIFICIAFYSTSKILIYLFLAERVFVAWQANSRRQSPVYIVSLLSIACYAVIVVTLVIGRIHRIREDGRCIIGLKSYASIGLLAFDLYINCALTTLFLWPLFRSHLLNPQVRRVTTRTFIAATASLTTSAINIAVLTFMKGQELGWVCLGSCALDVLFNAVALFWVSDRGSHDSLKSAQDRQLRPIGFGGGGQAGIQIQSHRGSQPGSRHVIDITRTPQSPGSPIAITPLPPLLASPTSPKPKAPLLTKYSNLEIMTDFDRVEVLPDGMIQQASDLERPRRFSINAAGAKFSSMWMSWFTSPNKSSSIAESRIPRRSRTSEPVVRLSRDQPSVEIHVTRQTTRDYLDRPYCYDAESHRIGPLSRTHDT